MAQHIGIVACSAEGAALCYRTICQEAPAQMGEHCHPEMTMHTYPLSEYMVYIRRDDWGGIVDLMVRSVNKLAAVGAEFAICPDNTIHEVYDQVAARSPIPWLHIAESVAREAVRREYGKLGITGTKYLMTGPVYAGVLKRNGLTYEIPRAADRDAIDRIIFSELVNGTFREESRIYFNHVIEKLKDRGCDAVVLGCTEIPLLVNPNHCPLPTLDSTRLLAREALRVSLSGKPI